MRLLVVPTGMCMYTEIAEYMHMPVGTIKSRIFFARKRLQNELRDYR